MYPSVIGMMGAKIPKLLWHFAYRCMSSSNISTTEPQDNVRDLLMEAVKETKITLIQRLNVKIGAAVAVRNVAYYIYRWTKVSKEQHQKPVALFAILNECKQIATTKNTWHCLLSWTTENKSKTKKTYGTVCYLKNECKQRGKQKNTCDTVCYRERM